MDGPNQERLPPERKTVAAPLTAARAQGDPLQLDRIKEMASTARGMPRVMAAGTLSMTTAARATSTTATRVAVVRATTNK